MSFFNRAVSIVALILCAFAGAVDATQIVYKSVPELGNESASVVRGKVTDVRELL